jgi:multidrug efflux pump subunit AcrA (membrane-fusion protein)
LIDRPSLESVEDSISGNGLMKPQEIGRALLAIWSDLIAELFRGGEASALTMDNARKAYQVASADVQEAQSGRAVALQEIVVRGAQVAQAQAGVAKAGFELRKTTLRAPVSGQVAPLKVRLGAYVSSGVVAIAIISSENWRVVANLPERISPGVEGRTKGLVLRELGPMAFSQGYYQEYFYWHF